MTAEQWQSVQVLFDSLADLPAGQRQAALEDVAHQTDAEVLTEVEKLLANADRGLFLDEPIPGLPDLGMLGAPQLSPGQLIAGRFEVIRLIGHGGMAEVYEVSDRNLDECVAIKVLRRHLAADERMVERFSCEVLLARKITHVNVCRIFDFGCAKTSGGQSLVFLTMELIEGQPLSTWSQGPGLTLGEKLDILRQVMDGVQAAHDAGVLHCDLKPSNLLVAEHEGVRRAVITDFGLARMLQPAGESKRTSRVFGTPAYISPEQIDGRPVSARTDIYALGLIIYEVVTGSLPFSGEPGIAFIKRITRVPSSPRTIIPSLPASWDRLILRCLDPDPTRRFASVAELKVAAADRRVLVLSGRIARRAVMAGGAGALIGAATLAWNWCRPLLGKVSVPAGARILLTQITVPHDDPELSGATSLLAIQLAQSGRIIAVDPNSLPDLLKLAQTDPSKPLDPETARHVSLRLGITLVLFGGISRIGDEFMLNLVLEQLGDSSKSAQHSWTYSGRARDRASMMEAIRDGARWIRITAGEAPHTVELLDKRPEDATTSSWEALQQFAAAERAKADGNRELAVGCLKLTISMDPKFALAHARLGDVLFNLHNFREGLRHWKLAMQLSTAGKLTRHEELRIRGLYLSELERFKEAEPIFAEYSRSFPHDDLGPFYLAYVLRMQMRLDDSLGQLAEADRRSPGAYYTSADRANCLLMAERWPALRNQINILRAAGHADAADRFQGTLLAIEGDTTTAEQTFIHMLANSSPQTRDWAATRLCYLWSETARYREAIELTAKTIEDARSAGDPQRSGSFLVVQAWIAWRAQDRAQFERAQAEASTYPLTPADFVRLGTLLARSRKLAGVLRLVGRMEADYGGEFPLALRKIRTEILLAEREFRAGLGAALDIDHEDAPVHCREYLANALWVAGQKQESQARYREIASKPNMLWYEVDWVAPGTLAEARERAGL